MAPRITFTLYVEQCVSEKTRASRSDTLDVRPRSNVRTLEFCACLYRRGRDEAKFTQGSPGDEGSRVSRRPGEVRPSPQSRKCVRVCVCGARVGERGEGASFDPACRDTKRSYTLSTFATNVPRTNYQTVTASPPAARPPCRSRAVRNRIERRVFCPCVLRKKSLDAHVRKLPGDDAGGDVVSAEPLQKATTRFLVSWSTIRDRTVVSGPRAFHSGARATLGIRFA